jgi:hypothetical protein
MGTPLLLRSDLRRVGCAETERARYPPFNRTAAGLIDFPTFTDELSSFPAVLLHA